MDKIMDRNEYLFAERLITQDMFIMSNIYVDISFLKYVELGDIFTHQDIDADIYTAITSIVNDDNFINRKTNDPEILFKDVYNIQKVLTPSKMKDDIRFAIAPSFKDAIETIIYHLNRSEESKRVIKSNNINTITIDLHHYPGLSRQMYERIVNEYGSIFNTNIRILPNGLKPIKDDVLKFDAFYVGDLGKFNDIMIDYLNNEKLSDKHFFCSKVLPLSKFNVNDEDATDVAFRNIELIMSATSRFQFIPPFSCLK